MLAVQTVRCYVMNVRANSLTGPGPWYLLLRLSLSQIGDKSVAIRPKPGSVANVDAWRDFGWRRWRGRWCHAERQLRYRNVRLSTWTRRRRMRKWLRRSTHSQFWQWLGGQNLLAERPENQAAATSWLRGRFVPQPVWTCWCRHFIPLRQESKH